MTHPESKLLHCKRCCRKRKHSLREVRGETLIYRCGFCHLTQAVPRDDKKEE